MNIEQDMLTLRLTGMSHMWQTLQESRKHLELELTDGLGILLQAESEYRHEHRLLRLEKAASFRYQASIEEIAFKKNRNINKSQLLTLADCRFIDKGEAVLITGSTGSGKSFIASALGYQACSKGYRTIYFNLKKLMDYLKRCRADGSIFKQMNRIAKQQLLILDDFGLSPMETQQRLDLLELIEDRHGKMATIICAQLPVANWYDVIGDDTIADAIMDRLIHQANRIELKGESMRKNR